MDSNAETRAALSYVSKLLKEKLPRNTYYYHDIWHTMDVYRNAVRYGKLEGLPKHEVLLLGIAALFHDTGYLKRHDNNEPIGAGIAARYLKGRDFSEKDVSTIRGLIMATQLPQRPKTLAQRIICDADLSILGEREFMTRNLRLMKELGKIRGRQYAKEEWIAAQLRFVRGHGYFTKAARGLRNETKRKNILRLKAIQKRLSA